jgi:hypothetical protein
MSTSAQDEMADRKRVMAQDASLREQGGTFMSHAEADAATPLGRFTQVNAAKVVGSTAFPQYPAAAPHQHDPCGQEPPLGYRIDDLEPSTVVTDVEAHGGPADAPASSLAFLSVERAGPSSSMAAQGKSQMSSSVRDTVEEVRLERPPYRRF